MDMLSLVSGTGVALKKVASTHGGEYAGPCPGCGGNDRFRCWPNDKDGRGAFWCRQCDKGGDDIQFMVEFMGYTYRQAFEAAGRSMPDNYTPAVCRPARERRKKAFEPRVFESPADLWRERALKFVEKAHVALLENKAELSYLAHRGLDLQAVKGFRLGWFEGENGKGCMFRSRESWGLETVLKRDGRKKVLWIPRGIVIPTFKKGEIYRIRVRRPSYDLKTDKDSRYFIVPGSGMEAAGHNPGHRAFVVVEADLDEMLVCRRAGSLVGTVALGSSTGKPGSDVFPVLKKAVRVLVSLDWDKAGRKAWEWWKKEFPNARFWPVPEGMGKDPGDAFENGLDIRDWVTAGLPPALTMEINHGYQKPEGMSHMQELQMLLSKYPVTIEATLDKGRIHFDPGFRHRGIRQRIHDLFYKDEDIYWYLKMYHPDDVISGDNLLVKDPA
ncbi:primase-helicase zinc-binding domain-containing protein [uncultured Desulfobacter sp.]|uniref:primase-helicase zinc-binding domain-containing protein n=1 Tax=uncultured Desulfobacter sp. TaxID=240139 RepID=UPI0029F5596A|nr:primase-helicase zinc-binding domain-containing protein [uncultured Desulfobacter sp.]